MSSAPSSPVNNASTALTTSTPELPYRKPSAEAPIVPSKKKATCNVFNQKLTNQQWKFIEYYMQGQKPYEAAKNAGYAESTCTVAYDVLLNNPDVQEEIQKRIDRYYQEIGIEERAILQKTLRFADSNLFDYGYVEADGTFKVDLKNVPRELGYAIQEYTVDSQGRPRIKLVDKLAAIGLLGKFRGMGIQKVQLTGKDGAPLTIQALDSIVAQTVVINQQVNNVPAPVERALPEVVNHALPASQ